jgi:dihydroorotate dehydrogenase
MLYEKLVKPWMFKKDPEDAHHLIMKGMDMAGQIPGGRALLSGLYGFKSTKELTNQIAGVTFPNPVGLAAGLDKNGQAVKAFSQIGFGFLEVGTVTPKPQPGNERPRLFRLPEDESLINRMGFNNIGTEGMEKNLQRVKDHPVPVGINIGKNKITPNANAAEDYQKCIQRLYPYGDFFVVNISSPNTPDLRNLQHGDHLRLLLKTVTEELKIQRQKYGSDEKPVFVKIAPDLKEMELHVIIDTIMQSGVSGVIATNTTISRDGLTHPNAKETGGLSGKPLKNPSTEIIHKIYKQTKGSLPIIGSGGIFTAEDAYEKIRAGASLVEIYTGLIYKGPELLKKINQQLLHLLQKDGFSHISQAVGSDH